MMEIGFNSLQSQLMTCPNATRLTRSLVSKYHLAERKAWFARLVSRLVGRSNGILSLEAALRGRAVAASHYAGLKSVAVDEIQGSEARTSDFDRSFNPLSGRNMMRWLSVARARLSEVPLPPVELIEVNGTYFVRDGHHRISVAHSLGERYIEAEVTVWEIPE
jgi:hypothetical protein